MWLKCILEVIGKMGILVEHLRVTSDGMLRGENLQVRRTCRKLVGR